jgi:glycerophosphoryl diester phosphodiesterase
VTSGTTLGAAPGRRPFGGVRGFVHGFVHAGRPVVVGHRGVRRPGLVENTMPAFEAAVAEGAEAIELDVRLCRSGEPVVLHDPTLERMTEGEDRRAAADVTLSELGRVELRSEGARARVPTLADVLAFARARRVGVNVELKHDVPSRPALVRAAARLLHGWDPAHPILISSFDPAVVAGIAALAPRVPRAILVHRTRWHMLHAGLALPLAAAAVHLERTLTRPDLVRALRARGLLVNVWTVNDPEEARDLAALGIDGLISDTPGEIRAALGG